MAGLPTEDSRVFVRAKALDGVYLDVDVLDLDEKSWRLFCLRKAMSVEIDFSDATEYVSRYPKDSY